MIPWDFSDPQGSKIEGEVKRGSQCNGVSERKVTKRLLGFDVPMFGLLSTVQGSLLTMTVATERGLFYLLGLWILSFFCLLYFAQRIDRHWKSL